MITRYRIINKQIGFSAGAVDFDCAFKTARELAYYRGGVSQIEVDGLVIVEFRKHPHMVGALMERILSGNVWEEQTVNAEGFSI